MTTLLKKLIVGVFVLALIVAAGCGKIDPDSTNDGRDPSELESVNGSK